MISFCVVYRALLFEGPIRANTELNFNLGFFLSCLLKSIFSDNFLENLWDQSVLNLLFAASFIEQPGPQGLSVLASSSFVATLQVTSPVPLRGEIKHKQNKRISSTKEDSLKERTKRCSHGGQIEVMSLANSTKGQHSPRTTHIFGDHFASFSCHPSARKNIPGRRRSSFILSSSRLDISSL